jgi:hypothetical protein
LISRELSGSTVNQKDLNERNQQVQHMKLIYKNATHVIAWLGEGSSNSKIYMDMLCMVKSLMEQGLYPPTTKPTMQQEALLFTTLASDPAFKERKAILESSDDQDRQYLASLCNEFCNNPWFERVWIVQEAVLAEYLILQYGSVTVDWNVHSSCCLNLLWSDLVSQNLSGSGISLTDTIHMLTDEHFSPLRKELFSLVNALKYQRATDAKDRVYAIQGLVKPKPSRGKSFTSTLHIDYTKTAAQLSKDFALWHIENEGTLDVLSVCCEATTSAGLPTWTIDLDRGHSYCDRIFSCELRTLEMYCAGMRRAIQSQYNSSIDGLMLAGIEFDRIEEVSTRLHSRELCAVPKTDTWSEWRNLALRGQTEDPYDDMEGRTEAFWRTMIANQMWDDEELKYVKAPSRLGDQFHRWSSHEDLDSAADARRIGRALGESGFYDFINNLLVGNQAQLFRTQGGYLGLTCEHVRPDDKIVILWGGRLPFLLRECKTKREIPVADVEGCNVCQHVITTAYQITGGQVYVHGIMEGEGIDLAERAGFQPQQFCIVA